MAVYRVDDFARVLKTHPRTILRAVAGKENTYWAPGFNPVVLISRVVNAYASESGGHPKLLKTLKQCFSDKDAFLKPQEAAKHLDVPVRTFRYRHYPVSARHGGVVRYSRMELINHHLAHHVRDN